ncbi:unnamed protein product [Euphydryas editha]|uniref:Uncharacterized protein n=1 Tax=Euphydryas editha TaxID=104508 RepID=A0AAU9V4V2_EUPED|nr:unnamed protein product [Euphydryas editha]
MTKYYQDKIGMCFRCNLSDAASVSCIIRGLPISLQPNARAFQCQRLDELYEAFLCALDDYRSPTFEARAPIKETKQFSTPDKKIDPEIDPCPRFKKIGHILRNCTLPDRRVCFKCGLQVSADSLRPYRSIALVSDSASSSDEQLETEDLIDLLES